MEEILNYLNPLTIIIIIVILIFLFNNKKNRPNKKTSNTTNTIKENIKMKNNINIENIKEEIEALKKENITIKNQLKMKNYKKEVYLDINNIDKDELITAVLKELVKDQYNYKEDFFSFYRNELEEHKERTLYSKDILKEFSRVLRNEYQTQEQEIYLAKKENRTPKPNRFLFSLRKLLSDVIKPDLKIFLDNYKGNNPNWEDAADDEDDTSSSFDDNDAEMKPNSKPNNINKYSFNNKPNNLGM